jgi:transposase
VRTALYMAALVASRHNPTMKAAYTAMREQGKPGKVALVAIARQLVVTANALVKTNQNWTPKP